MQVYMQHNCVGCRQIGANLCIQSVSSSCKYCNTAKLISSIGCRHCVASIGCSMILCIQSKWSSWNYCNKAKINEGIYVPKLNSHKLSLRIGCSIIPCNQSVSSACRYCINQQRMQAYMQSNRIHIWMQSNYLKC